MGSQHHSAASGRRGHHARALSLTDITAMASLIALLGIVAALVAVMSVTHSLRRMADAQEAAVQHLAAIERRLAAQGRDAGAPV